MPLGEFIEANKERLIERWGQNVVERLGLDLEKSQLRNNLPEFIDDVVEALRSGSEHCTDPRSAKMHGRQRLRIGVDVAMLAEEMTLVGESVAEIAVEQGYDMKAADLLRMMSIIGRGAAASVGAYAQLRDKQLADQAAQHFSFIAHEIRNPLHNAHLAAQSLEVVPEADKPRFLERLNRSLAQLAELVDDSLMDARLYGEPQLRLRRVDASRLVREICTDLELQAQERNLTLAADAEDFSLDADRTVLVSALTNIVKNAIKFTREGGRIEIRARVTEDRAVFEVSDECGGIQEGLLPHLFTRFVQGRHDKGGSGLGLVIVKQAAEAHHGSVRIDNEPGEGCTFVLELPLDRQEERHDVRPGGARKKGKAAKTRKSGAK